MLAAMRLFQIRLFAKLLELWGRTAPGCAAIRRLRGNRYANLFLRFLVGYRRTFGSFAEAERYVARFARVLVGHEHPDNIAYHSGLADSRLRESDYPVLFYLAPLAPDLRRVLDLGGNVGNLFYALQTELRFPEPLEWLVYDLPMMRSSGAELARKRNEPRLQFTEELTRASGCDLLIASGCLHYFERPLAEMLATLEAPPRRLLTNRTPCLREEAGGSEDLITVQDNDTYIVPSKVHNVRKLVESLAAAGYTLRASWPVYERHLWIPLYPDLSSKHYRGFYFVRRDPE